MSSKKDDLIVDLLQEVREDQRAHSTILIKLQQDVAVNTTDLTDHKEGVVLNRGEIKEHRERLQSLETPYTFLSNTKYIILTIGGISGSIYAIAKAIEYFSI